MERVIHLLDAIPYVRAYAGQIFVVKVGGDMLSQPKWRDGIARDLSALHRLNIRVVLVHGGGPQLDQASKDWGLAVNKVGGRRITTPEIMDAALMVWRGRLSSEWVQAFAKHGERAAGLSGLDGQMISASRRPAVKMAIEGASQMVTFGEVGDVTHVDSSLIETLHNEKVIPVISPIASGPNGAPLNVNADTIASELAISLKASKLMMLTQAPGILEDADDPNSVLHWADISTLDALRERGALRGGMLPKVASATRCLEAGVPRVHIVDGRRPGALLEEVFTTEGSGTLIVREAEACPAEPLGFAPIL